VLVVVSLMGRPGRERKEMLGVMATDRVSDVLAWHLPLHILAVYEHIFVHSVSNHSLIMTRKMRNVDMT